MYIIMAHLAPPQAAGRITPNLLVSKLLPIDIYNGRMGLISRGVQKSALEAITRVKATNNGYTGLAIDQVAVNAVDLTTDSYEHRAALRQIADEADVESKTFKEVQTTRFMMDPTAWSIKRSVALSTIAQEVYALTEVKMKALSDAHVPAAKTKSIAKSFLMLSMTHGCRY